ncbi:hypothetical protein AAX26_00273 [Aliarcobacter thereius]|uniref:Uncharacterized protein n=2 Tax=Aliarcobacter thereius TaxID=544718 RepID=A0A1C0B9J9_9BACT|nr:hypothetical protein [Aliarcobacter thereius]OCL88587.1 hypothetical protein AAX26_00273 [Aliarcobacter thereius]OCL92081.1 hypothetical protein AAX25_00811 [Aliarcobacter thereius]OCL94823.1 hypothetical protein AA347_00262 [Aliarcobacter thereius LMG 24486]OCM00270.1 hypothetical protein AAX29_00268 [Aliarcobacter thereius]QBF15302.1 hypothetical protein ATH_0212 [Aliarcobacter thereius LMG 24486]
MFFRFLIFIVLIISLNADETSSALTKQKMEVLQLKEDLTQFYNKKEKENEEFLKSIKEIEVKVEEDKKNIENLIAKNEELIKEIRNEITLKTTKIYEQMKPKIAAQIFDQMILEGKVEEVFDIIIRLKESNVSNIMKTLNIESASILTFMLENFKKEEKRD